jgi:hypothetical protein
VLVGFGSVSSVVVVSRQAQGGIGGGIFDGGLGGGLMV